MFVDGRTLPHAGTLDADLCIVGAGPAAITLARELSGRGIKVLMIESGGIDPEIRRKHLDRGSSIGYPYYNLMFTRARAFGGTSSRWHLRVAGDEGWMAGHLDPIDFEVRPTIPLTGWPFEYAHLEPYYRRAHAISDLGPPTFSVDDWERPGMERLPLRGNRVITTVLQRGMTRFSRFRDEFAMMPDVTVVYHATVTDLVSSGEPAGVEQVEVAIGSDRRFTVTARIFVLAAGGIENPRLLLSSIRQEPAGLGNGHDLVGRFFMEHLAGRIGYVRPVDPSLVTRSGLYDSHREGSVFVQASLTLTPDVLRDEGILNVAFFLLPRNEAFVSEGIRSMKAIAVSAYRRPRDTQTLGHLRNVAASARPILATASQKFLPGGEAASVLAVRTQSEQAPNPDSRITLGRGRDQYGVRRPAIDWRLSEIDMVSIRRAEEILDEELRGAGLGRIERMLGEENPPVVFEGDHHHMGTTRIGLDPRRGVVDPDGRVHGVRNLYVAGSSVFPTGGFMNPTLTIVAMAIRLADHLKGVVGTPIRV